MYQSCCKALGLETEGVSFCSSEAYSLVERVCAAGKVVGNKARS